MSQELEHQVEVKKPGIGSMAEVPNLGFVTRRKNSKRDDAWRETLTQQGRIVGDRYPHGSSACSRNRPVG